MVESVLHAAMRTWVASKHLRNVLKGKWAPMYDSDGNLLKGVRGRVGAVATSMFNAEIGVDLIEMQPGTAFPLHVHDGDHILYIESGTGAVHINGKNRRVKKGDSVFIAGEYPHGVVGPTKTAKKPLVIVAFGHPRIHVSAKNRMRHPHSHHGHKSRSQTSLKQIKKGFPR